MSHSHFTLTSRMDQLTDPRLKDASSVSASGIAGLNVLAWPSSIWTCAITAGYVAVPFAVAFSTVKLTLMGSATLTALRDVATIVRAKER